MKVRVTFEADEEQLRRFATMDQQYSDLLHFRQWLRDTVKYGPPASTEEIYDMFNENLGEYCV